VRERITGEAMVKKKAKKKSQKFCRKEKGYYFCRPKTKRTYRFGKPGKGPKEKEQEKRGSQSG
jgi:hypothetical protein